MNEDEIFMQRCLDLAVLGMGRVAPNPMVGAVIVHEGRIIGEGFHEVYGAAHAEVNAIRSVQNPSLLSKSTLYVSLEPCSHIGKTPPCSDLIIKHQFQRVVVGCKDPHEKVNGRGIDRLKKAGVSVTTGVLEQACQALNKRFFTFHQRRRPYVILKWAQSPDGFLDISRPNNETGIHWISSPETKVLVHKWRAEEQSILVGRKAVETDNPTLTVREFSGNNPTRIIIDSQLQLPMDKHIFSADAPTIIFNRIQSKKEGHLEWVKLPETSTDHILEELYNRNILSVFVEGGSRTLQYFIFGNVWDEARVIVGPNKLHDGTRAPIIGKTPNHSFSFSEDMIHYFYRK
jgi:diaminohydroxyphosphoribosylaminopyrimidine deaminase/5-amino-6-(5-phosphoribosylamino)uracil reductase